MSENLRIFNMQENCLQQDAGCIWEDTWSQALWERHSEELDFNAQFQLCVVPLCDESVCFKKSRLGLKSSFSKRINKLQLIL